MAKEIGVTVSFYPMLYAALAIAAFYAWLYCIAYYYIYFVRGARVTQTNDSYYCPRCKIKLGEITPSCPKCNEKLWLPEKRP